ncbi:glycosyl transferase family protein [Sphingomonas flavalba]|uniref:glycosyl transferase family protein n=1 Tax=Sphingomonas flavalba TaxID=2559804 RepID=UPI0039E14063
MGTEGLLWLLGCGARELMLFAAAFILIGGLDDLIVDLIWAGRSLWRRVAVYTIHRRADAASLPPPAAPGRIAVFVPAWREAAVVGQMLSTAAARFGAGDWRIYVGCYPNDAATTEVAAAAATRDPRIRVVIGPRAGPTTKADNLNHLWAALLRDEVKDGRRVKAVALHDAEDVVHPAEIALFDALAGRFDLIQLPVLPLIDADRPFWRRFVSGGYADEFAEAHTKMLVVREALGAAVPAAGVGCAVARGALARIADAAGGRPFDGGSMTEDYELGLRIAEQGGRGIFVRLPGRRGGAAVAVRAHFPNSWDAAIRQRSRWMAGIALHGWDRMGWRGGLAERWMRMRDRRAVLAAAVLFAAYAGMAAWLLCGAVAPAGHAAVPFSRHETLLLAATAALLGWRMAFRFAFVAHAYGVREGLYALPRAIVANIVTMLAARRAVARYLRRLRGGALEWDKTDHVFPDRMPAV